MVNAAGEKLFFPFPLRQEELEKFLLAAPAGTWHEAAEKARYLLTLFAVTPAAQDPCRQKLIADLLDDFSRLSSGHEAEGPE